MKRWVRNLLLVHGVLTGAAGVVLIVFPAAIPSTVGIALDRGAYLLCWLLAGMELGAAWLSLQARKLSDTAALRAIFASFIVLHASTALLEVWAIAQGGSPMLWPNVALRAGVTAAFVLASRSV